MSANIEPPIRTETPLSEAGESSSELGTSVLATLQESSSPGAQYLVATAAAATAGVGSASASSSNMSHETMSKAAHDAIFGRAASASSQAPLSSPAIVAHEDEDSPYGYTQHLEQQLRLQQQQQQQQQQLQLQQQMGNNPNVPVVQMPPHVVSAGGMANNNNMMTSTGRSPRLMPVQAPSNPAAAPTALMIMRRRRSNSTDANHSGSNSSGHKSHKHQLQQDELGLSNSGRSGSGSGSRGGGSSSLDKSTSKSSSKSPKIAPRNSPKKSQPTSAVALNNNGQMTSVDQLNFNALLQQQQQQQAYAAQQMHHTAMRYNSSLHSTLGGYPMGTPSQLTPPSVTLELIARDRARWEADYYGNFNGGAGGAAAGSGGSGMDYGYDYGMDTTGGYYGATPSFRGMSAGMGLGQQGLGQQMQQPQQMQQANQGQPGQQGGRMEELKRMEQFYQPRIQSSIQAQLQLQQQQELQQAQQLQQVQQQQVQQQQVQQQQSQQQLKQPSPEGGSPSKQRASRSPALSPVPSVSTTQDATLSHHEHNMPKEIKMTPSTLNRVYQSRDYKTDRVWQEDDHTSTKSISSASKPERRNTDKTSNREEDKHQEERSIVTESQDLPPVPKLRTNEEDEVKNQKQETKQQVQVDKQPAPPVQPAQQPGQQPQVQQLPIPQGVPQGRPSNRMSIDNLDILQYQHAMAAQYYQQAPPSTPVRHSDPSGNYPNQRVRQISDISSVAGSVGGGLPMVYPNPHHHPHYGLIYPPTPGSLEYMPPQAHMVYQQQQQQVDPRQVGGMWVDPHLQQHLPKVQQQQQTKDTSAGVQDTSSRPKSPAMKASSPLTKSVSAAPAPPPPPHSSSAPPRMQGNPNESSNSKAKKRVSFSHLQIRTYETILGDNPSCSGGPSLGLGWRYDPSHFTATVDEYEAYLAQIYGLAEGQQYECRPEDLVLHRYEREAILLNTGYTRQDLADSVRAINKVKNKRRQTVHNLPVAFVEERVEVAKRTLKRWLGKKERTRHMYEDWKKKNGNNSSQR